MLRKIIIADTSCLIALQNINELDILQKIYQQIIITPEVEIEFGQTLPNWIVIEPVKNKANIELLELELDKGESSAIALAVENPNCLLLIDERKGRVIAKKLGLSITGILGVIIKAKELNLIPFVKPYLNKLESINFRIAEELKFEILKKVAED